MWSLYKRKEDDDGGIFDFSGEKLEPLRFSNGKTQADVVKEVLDAVEKGNKIIFIRGVCGSGKSAMALNLARHFNKTSIVVPIKSLQEQYEHDYTKEKFLLKDDKNKLKISVIKGRNNFRCRFMGERADDEFLPCCIELREKNMDKILEYIDMNEDASREDFSGISDVRRMAVAAACPYWSPLLPSEVSSKTLENSKKFKYKSSSGKDFALFQRKKGCDYYDQYEAYSDSDVLIFNAHKYIIETIIGRKPKTDLDIIDECDEFLDNFANERKLNLNRFVMSLSNIFPSDLKQKEAIKEMLSVANSILYDAKKDDVEKVVNTKMVNLIDKILENPYIAEEEEKNYYNTALEIAKEFENLIEETYVSFSVMDNDKNETLFGVPKKEATVIANLVSINLAEKFKEIAEANNVLVLMSGTLHSEKVLKDIFGLENFKLIEAETKTPGFIRKYRTGLEKNCKYSNFSSGQVTRKDYLVALSTCLKNAEPPVLIHVNSFQDLPSEEEKKMYDIDNVISREKLKELQRHSKKEIDSFRSGESDILFTTKCSRGVDFPGDKCKSIILTKYPYPNINSLFWKILRKEQPNKFMEFYLDKANRELIQKIARGVRFKGDYVLLLSPDERILNARVS